MKVAPEELELYDQLSSFMRVHVGLWSPILKEKFRLEKWLEIQFWFYDSRGNLKPNLEPFFK